VKYRGVVLKGGRIYTKYKGKMRLWSPYRSKLAAAMKKGLKNFPFEKTSTILYLGAASGTTVSHLSDVCSNGWIFAVEISPRIFRDLLALAEERKNIIPILADARKPEKYGYMVSQVDIIYQDIAQRDQTEILLKNLQFLKPGGYIFYAIKTRSIDVSKKPSVVVSEEAKKIKDKIKILEKISLEPYAKDHYMLVGIKKSE